MESLGGGFGVMPLELGEEGAAREMDGRFDESLYGMGDGGC